MPRFSLRRLLILVTCLCVGLFAASWFFREPPRPHTTVANLRVLYSNYVVLQGPKDESKLYYYDGGFASPAGHKTYGSVRHGGKMYHTPTNPAWTMETRMICLVGVQDDQLEWLVLGLPGN